MCCRRRGRCGTGARSHVRTTCGRGQPMLSPMPQRQPAPPLQPGAIVAVRRDGTSRRTVVDQPVQWVVPEADGLILAVADPVITTASGGGWSYEYSQRTVRCTYGQLDGPLRIADLPRVQAPRRRPHYYFEDIGPSVPGRLWNRGGRARVGGDRLRATRAIGHPPSRPPRRHARRAQPS